MAKYSVKGNILIFDPMFNKELTEGFIADPNISEVRFGWHFNSPIQKDSLPPNTRTIELNPEFNISLDLVHFPNGVENILFGASFEQPLLPGRLPDSVKFLLYENFSDKLLLCTENLPKNLETLVLLTEDYDNASLERLRGFKGQIYINGFGSIDFINTFPNINYYFDDDSNTCEIVCILQNNYPKTATLKLLQVPFNGHNYIAISFTN